MAPTASGAPPAAAPGGRRRLKLQDGARVQPHLFIAFCMAAFYLNMQELKAAPLMFTDSDPNLANCLLLLALVRAAAPQHLAACGG